MSLEGYMIIEDAKGQRENFMNMHSAIIHIQLFERRATRSCKSMLIYVE